MQNIYKYAALILPMTILAACTTTKIEEEVVEVTPPPIEQTCVPINTLTKVVIPAEVKTGFSIVSIESEDEQYFDEKTKKWVTIKVPPIERKEPWTKVIKPEEIFYVDSQNKEITDICEPNDATPKVARVEDTAAGRAPTVGADDTQTNPAPSGVVEESDLTDALPQ